MSQEARDLPFIGERLADKVYEIISSGRLRRLDHVDREKENTIKMFMGVHGIGQTTAEQFYTRVIGERKDGAKSVVAIVTYL